MLGKDYMGCLGEDPARTSNGVKQPEKSAEVRRYLDLILTKGLPYVEALVSRDSTANVEAYNQAVQEYEQAGFFERNTTLITGLGIIGGITLLAIMTGRKRRR